MTRDLLMNEMRRNDDASKIQMPVPKNQRKSNLLSFAKNDGSVGVKK